MQLYITNGAVVAWYDDGVTVPAGAHPGAAVQSYAGAMTDLGRVGDAPPKGVYDARPYAAPELDLAAYATRVQAAHLAAGQVFNVAASGATPVPVLCDGTNDTRADLALLALYGQDNPAGTKTWLANDGKTTVLTGAQLVTLATLAGNWIAETYPVLVGVMGGIAAGTVTTTAAIDAAFAAVTA